MADIGSLTINLEAQVAGFQKKLKQADKSLNSSTARMNKAMAAADKRARAFRSTMMRLGATIGSAALIRGMQQFGSNTVNALDSIGKMSSSIDVSAESLQEWRFAATQSSIGAEELDQALERLNRRVGEARAGEGEFASVAEELNINLSTTETAFRDVAEAIRTAEDSADAGRIAADAFGRSGLRLINMLRNSEKSLEEMSQEARSMGIIIEERLVKSAERASSEFDRFNRVIEANLQKGYIRQLTGDMDDLSSTLRSQELARGMETIGSGIGAISGFAIDAAAEIGSLRTEISALFDEAQNMNRRNLAKTAIGNKFGLFDLLEEWGLIDAAGIPGGSPLNRLNDRSLGSPQQMPPRSHNLNTITIEDDDSGSGGSKGRDSGSGPFGPATPSYMIDAFRELREARDDRLLELHNQKLEEGAALTRQFATAQQQHASRMAEYRELLDEGAIGFDTFQRAAEASREQLEGFDTVQQAISNNLAQFGDIVGSAFEDAIIAGESLSDVLQGLATDMQRLLLRSAMQQGSDALMGFVGDALGGAFGGGGGFTPVDTRTPMGSTMPANPFHTGGIAGQGVASRLLPSSVFDSAPRFHSGRIPSGIGANEMPAVIRRDEGIFTPGQMKALAPAGDTEVNVTVENYSGQEARTEERTNARGGRDIKVIVGEMVGSEMAKFGSRPNRVLRKQFGARQRLTQR